MPRLDPAPVAVRIKSLSTALEKSTSSVFPLSSTLGGFTEHLLCSADPTTLWGPEMNNPAERAAVWGCCREPKVFLWLHRCPETQRSWEEPPAGQRLAGASLPTRRRLSASPCWQHPTSVPFGKRVVRVGTSSGPGEAR